MKNLRRKTLSFLALLMMAILSLTGVTYAWFTQGEKASINEFKMDVESVTGLQISTDGINWYNEIKDFVYNGLLTPVSTIGEIDSQSKNVKFYRGTHQDGYLTNVALATESTESTTKGYFALTLFFLNTGNTNINVALSDGDAFVTTVNDTSANSQLTRSSALCARIGFQKRGETGKTAGASVISELSSDAGTDNVKIFEPNYGIHTQEAINAERATNGQKVSYYGLKKAGVGPISTTYNETENGEYYGSVSTITGLTDTIFTINGDSIACVTIYIWLEGQDVDCTNFVSGKPIYVNLKFVRVGQN